MLAVRGSTVLQITNHNSLVPSQIGPARWTFLTNHARHRHRPRPARPLVRRRADGRRYRAGSAEDRGRRGQGRLPDQGRVRPSQQRHRRYRTPLPPSADRRPRPRPRQQASLQRGLVFHHDAEELRLVGHCGAGSKSADVHISRRSDSSIETWPKERCRRPSTSAQCQFAGGTGAAAYRLGHRRGRGTFVGPPHRRGAAELGTAAASGAAWQHVLRRRAWIVLVDDATLAAHDRVRLTKRPRR